MSTILEGLQRIAEAYGLDDVYAFGSRAKEVARLIAGQVVEIEGEADVDIGIQPTRGRELSARDRVRIADELERLFKAPRVDVVVLPEARAFLATEVIRGELLYTADPLDQAERELYVLRRAADLAPFRNERVRQILVEGGR
jgi:uncharacterized protein